MSNDAIVFIVDDDEAVRQSTAWLIESIGLKVTHLPVQMSFWKTIIMSPAVLSWMYACPE